MKILPYGLAGGGPATGAINEMTTNAGTHISLPSKINRKMERGDLVRHVQPGGGGFGDPLTRDPARVAHDVWNTKISAAYAHDNHRVVVDPDSGELDVAATAALRSAG
jgi:N-methylhydantoinase B